MTCGGCEHAVKKALRQVEGVEEVTASHRASQVGVTFDATRVTRDRLKEKSEALGYSVSP
jgi:copper chaperone CopZ